MNASTETATRTGRKYRIYRHAWLLPALLSVAWCIGPRVSALGGRSEAERRPLLRVNLCDDTNLVPETLAALKQEVSALYTTAGVDIVWHHECGSDETAASLAREDLARVYVLDEIPTPIVFRRRRFLKLPVMGYNLTAEDGSFSPVIYVSRKAIERAVRIKDSKQLARALGRIIAHELAHRFLQSMHVSQGILRANIEHHDWIDDDPGDLYFTPAQTTALQCVAAPNAPRKCAPKHP